jgi:hypothetical protein
MTSPEVQRAQVQTRVAEEQHRTAELQRETVTIRAQGNAKAPWEPVMVGAEHIALLALLIAVPLALVGVLVGTALLFPRHVSLPTSDGRVPLVGLDREFSQQALQRYQRSSRRARCLRPCQPNWRRLGFDNWRWRRMTSGESARMAEDAQRQFHELAPELERQKIVEELRERYAQLSEAERNEALYAQAAGAEVQREGADLEMER